MVGFLDFPNEVLLQIIPELDLFTLFSVFLVKEARLRLYPLITIIVQRDSQLNQYQEIRLFNHGTVNHINEIEIRAYEIYLISGDMSFIKKFPQILEREGASKSFVSKSHPPVSCMLHCRDSASFKSIFNSVNYFAWFNEVKTIKINVSRLTFIGDNKVIFKNCVPYNRFNIRGTRHFSEYITYKSDVFEYSREYLSPDSE